MDNNYFTPPDVLNFFEYEYEPNTYLESPLDLDTIGIPPMLDIDWDSWMDESPFSPQKNIGNADFIPPMQLTENSFAAPLPSLRCNANFASQDMLLPLDNTANLPDFDDLEQLLFSSTESLAQIPTPSSSWYTEATPNHLPMVASTQSGEPFPFNSTATNSASPSQVQAFSCRFCAQSFAKRHLLNRHEKQHDRPVVCPMGCGHHTARNRDMQRHIAVHHPAIQPVSRHMCGVPGCKSAKDGFTRKDNLTRHMKKAHGKLKA